MKNCLPFDLFKNHCLKTDKKDAFENQPIF